MQLSSLPYLEKSHRDAPVGAGGRVDDVNEESYPANVKVKFDHEILVVSCFWMMWNINYGLLIIILFTNLAPNFQ